MTDRELAAQAEAHLRRTTISYPDWQRRVAAGKYTPKDGSSTEWGKAFASLEQIGIEEPPPPPPPDPTEPPEYRHTYTGAQVTSPNYGWDWGMQYTGGATVNGFQLQPAGITTGLPSGLITLPATSGGVSIEGLRKYPLVVGAKWFYGMMVRFPATWATPSSQGWGAAIAQLGYQGLVNHTWGLFAHADHVQWVLLSGEQTWPGRVGDPNTTPIREYNNSTELGAWPNAPRAIPSARFAVGVWHQIITEIRWAYCSTESRLYDSSQPTGLTRIWHRQMGGSGALGVWTLTVERLNIPTLQWGYGYDFSNDGIVNPPYWQFNHPSPNVAHKFGLYSGPSGSVRSVEHGNIAIGASFGSVAGVMPT